MKFLFLLLSLLFCIKGHANTNLAILATLDESALNVTQSIDFINVVPSIAIDRRGNAIAVWEHEEIFATSYDHLNQAWNPPIKLHKNAVRRAMPKVEMDDDGNALTVWMDIGVQWAYYDNVTKDWSLPRILTEDLSSCLRIAKSKKKISGLWFNEDNFTIQTCDFDLSAKAWSAPISVCELPKEAEISSLTLWVDLKGNKFVSWKSKINDGEVVVTAYYDCIKDLWTGPMTMDSEITECQGFINSKGNPVIFFCIDDGDIVVSSEYDVKNSEWKRREFFGIGLNPLVKSNFSGEVAMASSFISEDDKGLINYMGLVHWIHNKTTQESKVIFMAENFSWSLDHDFAIDEVGNVIAIWYEIRENETVEKIEYYNAISAKSENLLYLSIPGMCLLTWAKIVMHPSGHAAVIWVNREKKAIQALIYRPTNL